MKVERVSFDPSNRYLEIHWRNKRVVAYCPVPEE
ncbi:MAG: KTSC domain-containing protein, partial [Burkholderiaceae bacterium]